MITIPISSPATNFENAGGKGASLARLTRLGLPVPPGFIVTTDAYGQFLAANDLLDEITAILKDCSFEDREQLQRASTTIRLAFSTSKLPEEIAEAVAREYCLLDRQAAPVAVRSSATTEDLPDLSFAGQQDTYLNIIGETQLYKALVDCWSGSLQTHAWEPGKVICGSNSPTRFGFYAAWSQGNPKERSTGKRHGRILRCP